MLYHQYTFFISKFPHNSKQSQLSVINFQGRKWRNPLISTTYEMEIYSFLNQWNIVGMEPKHMWLLSSNWVSIHFTVWQITKECKQIWSTGPLNCSLKYLSRNTLQSVYRRTKGEWDKGGNQMSALLSCNTKLAFP